jgi:hypothetical protein
MPDLGDAPAEVLNFNPRLLNEIDHVVAPVDFECELR